MNIKEKQILTWRIAVIAGIFSTIVSIIMVLNYWQLQRSEPLENELLISLVEQLRKDAGNEQLKEDIRGLDLMVRKAYFTSQWQIRAGAFMLIGGMIVLVISLRMYSTYTGGFDEPGTEDRHLGKQLLVSQRYILYAIIAIFGLALAAAFLSDDQLAETYSLTLSGEESTNPEIEEIVIRSGEETQAQVGQTGETGAGPEVQTAARTGLAGDVAEAEPTEESGDDFLPADETDEGTDKISDIGVKPESLRFMDQFPSFRGPNGLGISYHKNLPVDWDGATGKNIIWKANIPLPGYNSPVIWGDRIFLTGATSTEQHIYCYDRNTGKLLWDHPVNDVSRSSTGVPRVTDDTGYAAPTVVTDGNRVCAIYATGDVVCVDLEGRRLWAKNLGLPDNHYGHSSSLLIFKDLLIVQFDTNKEGKVMALYVASGDQKWATLRKSKVSWASPVLATIGDRAEIILSSSPEVAAYDPDSGKELWTLDCLMGEVGPSLAFDNGVVFAANEYAVLVAIKPGSPPQKLWETNEYLPEVSSPVADDGMLFLGTSYGVIACYDAAGGEILWEYECDDGIYASPMISDNKVFFLDMSGKMYIFSKEKTMKLLGEPELGEHTVSTPAFANGRIYLRSIETLYCIGN